MIGVDSNILLRYVTNDDPVWSPAAIRFIDGTCSADNPAYINPVVLAEAVWVLRRRPDFDRRKLAEFVQGLLDSDSMVVAERDAVERALVAFERGPAGFADYLIAEINTEANAVPTYTIDYNASRGEAFRALRKEA
ncbi:MAG: PIN domain-containing protein [Hyphomicrobiales bacterium]